MSSSNRYVIVAAMVTAMTTAQAQANDYGQGRGNYSAAIALDNADGRHRHWKAVGRLQVNQPTQKSRCTASLMDTRDDSSDTAGPAYILTSGHCVTRNSLNFMSDRAVEGHVDFDHFLGNTDATERYALKRVVHASMRGIDLAIIELDTSLQSLLDKGIEPLALSTTAPVKGAGLMIVGVPSGHEDAPGLRLATCPAEGVSDLVEGVFVFRAFHKHRCAGIAPGSSGSPLLDRQSNRIIGVLSTSTGRAIRENRCQTDAPCKIEDGQPTWSPDTQYSSPAIGLRTCFSQGVYNPSDLDCVLNPTLTMTLEEGYRPRTYTRIGLDEQGNPTLPRWSWPFSLDTPYYRYKTARSAQQCHSPHHYSDAIDAHHGLIDDVIGPEPGLHLLCIIGVQSQAQLPAPQMMDKPIIVATELAAAGPTRMPELKLEQGADGDYSVTPYYSSPALWVYTFKSGKPDEVKCEDPAGYTPDFSPVIAFEHARLPLKLCSTVYEMSRQPSLPRTDLLLP